MKNITINRRNPGLAEGPARDLTPHDPPPERCTHKVVLNVFGKRFELTRHVEVREFPKGDPARVIEMPGRRAIEP
jgi:hypothetical protein